MIRKEYSKSKQTNKHKYKIDTIAFINQEVYLVMQTVNSKDIGLQSVKCNARAWKLT